MSGTFADHLRRLSDQAAALRTVDAPGEQTYASVVLAMALAVGASQSTEAVGNTSVASGSNSASARLGISLVIPETIAVSPVTGMAFQPASDGGLVGLSDICITGRAAGASRVSAYYAAKRLPDLRFSYRKRSTASAANDQSQTSVGCSKSSPQSSRSAHLQLRLPPGETAESARTLTLVFAPE